MNFKKYATHKVCSKLSFTKHFKKFNNYNYLQITEEKSYVSGMKKRHKTL